MKEEKIRVLFVCLGNICRSPTVEAVFKERVEKSGWGKLFEIDSAGTANFHIGKAPDQRTQEHALGRGYNLSNLKARQLESNDFEHFDFVLVMDKQNLSDAQRVRSKASNAKAELKLFLDYLPEQPVREMPDPYYGGPEGFEEVLDLSEQGADSLLRTLLKKQGVLGCGC